MWLDFGLGLGLGLGAGFGLGFGSRFGFGYRIRLGSVSGATQLPPRTSQYLLTFSTHVRTYARTYSLTSSKLAPSAAVTRCTMAR